jgi:hypothetical protein
MFPSFERSALVALIGLGVVLGAGAQTQTGAASAPSARPSNTPQAAETRAQPVASAPAEKKKGGSRARTPPGKAPGGDQCSQGDKAHRQRCLNDMYGPGAPRL